MNWLKKWYYLILFVSTGAVYLTCVNDWQIYVQHAAAVRGWYDDVLAFGRQHIGNGPGQLLFGSGMGKGEGQPSGSGVGSGMGKGEGQPSGSGVGSGMGNGEDQPSGSGVGSGTGDGENQPSGSGTGSGEERPSGDGAEGSAPGTSAAADENGEISKTGDEAPSEEGTPPGDDPEQPDVTYMTVEDDYFADAVFIGDSRTVGMGEYGGLEDISTFYASTGLAVRKLFTAEIVSVQGQKKKITVEEALQQNTFSKIYFMLGINEMGVGTVDTFMEKYEEAVARLRELQPDAIIYLQGIMKVTAERSEKGDYITNEGIEERNERISQLADNKKIFYLDVNPAVCDETGGMIASYTYDGVHLKGKYIAVWKEFLKEHAIAQEDSGIVDYYAH